MQKANPQVPRLPATACLIAICALEDVGEDTGVVEGRDCQDVPFQPEQRHHRGGPSEDETDPEEGLWLQELRELQVEGQGVIWLI